MNKMRRLPKVTQRGFTIIELMIATLVFSVILLLVTAGILQIARVYYKGHTESNTQNTARSIIDSISQAIQFTGGTVTETTASPTPGTDYAFCINSTQVSYRLGWQVENRLDAPKHQAWHGVVMRSGVSGCSGQPAQNLGNQTVTGRDLVNHHMRLADLQVDSLGANRYRVTVRVAYGDDDLLYSPAAPADSAGATRPDAKCKPVQAGTQFCAVSELSTVVVKRVE
jgi:prepilin-type N-terminal cleavage/methylation domain-containing protein